MSAADRQRYATAAARLERAAAAFGDEYEIPVNGPGGTTYVKAGRVTTDLDGQALAKLLIQKGIITRDEAEAALADYAEAEVLRIAAALGVTLP